MEQQEIIDFINSQDGDVNISLENGVLFPDGDDEDGLTDLNEGEVGEEEKLACEETENDEFYDTY